MSFSAGTVNINFPCSADHEQDWQPYPWPLELFPALPCSRLRLFPIAMQVPHSYTSPTNQSLRVQHHTLLHRTKSSQRFKDRDKGKNGVFSRLLLIYCMASTTHCITFEPVECLAGTNSIIIVIIVSETREPCWKRPNGTRLYTTPYILLVHQNYYYLSFRRVITAVSSSTITDTSELACMYVWSSHIAEYGSTG